MISYAKLWILMQKKGLKRMDLIEDHIIARGTLTKLGKNETVSMDVISKICDCLDCQPGDIMERITKEDAEKAMEVMSQKFNELFDTLSAVTGKSRAQLSEEMKRDMPAMLKAFANGEDVFNMTLPREEE